MRLLSQSLVLAGLLATAAPAFASTITQNSSWTIDRSGTSTKYRVTAYGDSIYAGYNGGLWSVLRRAAPMVVGEYASARWGTDVEVVRRCKSGAVASDIYNSKIVSDRSYMQATNTRVVMFEMCGNDYLQARSEFKGQGGTCNYTGSNNALANCVNYTVAALDYINANAYSGTKVKIVSNLYYPGYNADNVTVNCTDSATGQRPNFRDTFLPVLLRSNWRTCNNAIARGWKCADAFAEFMGADYDTNGDGLVDSDALRYVQGESEDAYVARLLALKSTLRDSNTHFVNSSTTWDYLQSDDTHPTASTGSTISLGLFSGTGSGSGAPEYSATTQNGVWNRYGHERMGWTGSVFLPATP